MFWSSMRVLMCAHASARVASPVASAVTSVHSCGEKREARCSSERGIAFSDAAAGEWQPSVRSSRPREVRSSACSTATGLLSGRVSSRTPTPFSLTRCPPVSSSRAGSSERVAMPARRHG